MGGDLIEPTGVVLEENTGKTQTRFSFYPPLAVDGEEDYPCLDDENFVIEGHCRGTVCFSTIPDGKIFLYTPATGDLLKLPPAPSILLLHLNDGSQLIKYGCDDYNGEEGEEPIRPERISIGFGYDSKSRDFKVVRVVGLGKSSFEFRIVQVYELGKHEWREITRSHIPEYYCMASNTSFDQYYQGLFYWWGVLNTVPLTEIIVWFDMSEEIFGQIPMPEDLNFPHFGSKRSRRSLGFLNGTMVLLYYPFLKYHPPLLDEIGFDVWGMSKNYAKLFSIGPLFGIQKPLAFVTSDQLLIETYDGQLILFNINTKHSKHIPIKGSLSYCEHL